MTPLAAAKTLDLLYGSPLSVVSSCLRGMLCAAPGHELLAADFANIEGRGLAWLAGEEWKLQAFREYDAGTGPDLYLVAAAKMYKKPIDQCKPHRQAGKVSELSLGYQGGLGAFRQMEKNLGASLGLSDAEVQEAKQGWRDAHPLIVRYWYDLENAALQAVLNPGQIYAAGAVGRVARYRVKGSFLWCQLPTGRVLCYSYPEVRQIDTPWGEKKEAVTYMTVLDSTARKKSGKLILDPSAKGDWQRVSTYGGKLSENITQAICRDLLAGALVRAEAAGYPVVLHVHDEVVSEMPIGKGDIKEFERLCAETPAWAAGLPVTAAGWRGARYRK